MGLKIEEIVKEERIAPEDLYAWAKNEIRRVEEAINEARERYYKLSVGTDISGKNAAKITELNTAISVGKIYLTKLKNKWGF